MLLTNEKIAVSHEMMQKENMTRMNGNGVQYGIPVNPNDTNEGLSWKNMMDIEDEEFDKIEDYFINKQNA